MDFRENMTSRERVIAALDHRKPDRVPIDLGGTVMSGIMAEALVRLRRSLGLDNRPVKVYDVFQMLGEVELDLVEKLHVDVLPIDPPAISFNIRHERYKPWTLFDSTEVLVPGDFNIEVDSDGSWLLRDGGRMDRPVVGRMPKDGYYFENLETLKQSDEIERPDLSTLKERYMLTDEELEYMAGRASTLRKCTDKALVIGAWHISGLGRVGSLTNFLLLVGIDREYVKDYLCAKNEVVMQNLELLWQAIGSNADVIGLDGTDFGTQRCELISPMHFQELYAPLYKKQNAWVHENTTWKTLQHCCGSIAKIMPMLAEAGLDAINPVQCSAEGMDPRWLKKEFGQDLVFWGGGVDTQSTLPFGTPDDVREQVRQRIEIFAPEGGYIFCPVHNIQHGTPSENIIAAYEAAYEYGWDMDRR